MAKATTPTPDVVETPKPAITGFYDDLLNKGITISFQFPNQGGSASLGLANTPDDDPRNIVRNALQSLIDII